MSLFFLTVFFTHATNCLHRELWARRRPPVNGQDSLAALLGQSRLDPRLARMRPVYFQGLLTLLGVPLVCACRIRRSNAPAPPSPRSPGLARAALKEAHASHRSSTSGSQTLSGRTHWLSSRQRRGPEAANMSEAIGAQSAVWRAVRS